LNGGPSFTPRVLARSRPSLELGEAAEPPLFIASYSPGAVASPCYRTDFRDAHALVFTAVLQSQVSYSLWADPLKGGYDIPVTKTAWI
jgi:hypothetical protein